jgi:hypothetical protein
LTAFANSAFADVALVLDERSGIVMSVESQLIADIAQQTVNATVIHPNNDGTFTDRVGNDVSLNSFSVLWIHHGEPLANHSPLRSAATLTALRKHGAVLLTGCATTLLEPLELDVPKTKPKTFGNDREQFGLVPVAPVHPLFAALDLDRNTLWLSNAAYYAFESFVAPKGTILAANPGGQPAPLLEYAFGNGKLLAVLLRVGSLYGLAPEGHRRNFEQLTTNLLRYLDGTLPAAVSTKNPFEDEAVALQLAVENLCTTFGEHYPDGKTYLVRLAEIRRT